MIIRILGAALLVGCAHLAPDPNETASLLVANVTRISVSDVDRAAMDEAVAKGLDAIFTDYESRGIADARAIYDAINAD